MLLSSLHLETHSGALSRSPAAKPALRAARAVIRQRGFTILQAYCAIHGVALPGTSLPEARAAWRAAEKVCMAVWDRTAPVNCPRAPRIRLTVAVRRKPRG